VADERASKQRRLILHQRAILKMLEMGLDTLDLPAEHGIEM
jgi:hypothetical protein